MRERYPSKWFSFLLPDNNMLEVCVDNITSVNAAVEGGAQRIELCSALSEGGLTPTVGFLKIVKRTVN